MKFNLKKLLVFALVILLIWTVYNMFFGKIIEGAHVWCTAQTNSTNCRAKGCFWANPKPARTYTYRGKTITEPAYPGGCS